MKDSSLVRGGRLLKYKGQVVSQTPSFKMAALALAIGATSVQAVEPPGVFTGQNDGELVYTTSKDITVGSGATVGTTNRTETVVFYIQDSYDDVFESYGIIQLTSDGTSSSSGGEDFELNGGFLVWVDQDFTSGTFLNEGTMDLMVDGVGEDGFSGDGVFGVALQIGNDGELYLASGSGTGVDESLASNASITNDSSITVSVEDDEASVFAAGIVVEGDIEFDGIQDEITENLSILNDGSITVNAYANEYSGGGTSGDQDAYAFGILLGDWEIQGEDFGSGSGSGSWSADTSGDGSNFEYERVDLDGGSIINTGTLTVGAYARPDDSGGGSDDATAMGIELGNIGATAETVIRNTGDIFVTAVATNDAQGEGISVGNLGAFALVENASGAEIRLNVNGGNSATAEGIEVDDMSIAGSVIRNTGSIVIDAYSDGAVDVSGIEVDNELGDFQGLIENGVADGELGSGDNGLIQIRVDLEGPGSVVLKGIYLSDGNDNGNVGASGAISNYGVIDIQAEGTDLTSDFEMYGIEVHDIAGRVTNAGLIRLGLDATSMTDSSFTILGIHAEAIESSGVILNSGRIEIDLTVQNANDTSTSVYLAGIDTWDVRGQVINSGTIDIDLNVVLTSDGFDSTFEVYGIWTDDIEAGGRVINSGRIEISGTADGLSTTASMYGIRVGVESDGIEQDGSLVNSGVIQIDIEGSDSEIEIYGIYIDGGLTGTLLNSGTISLDLSVTNDSASATGIWVNNAIADGGVLTNSGTIDVVAEGMNSASAVGIEVDDDIDVGGVLVNTGTIIANAILDDTNGEDTDEYATGIYVNGALNGELRNSGTIAAYTGDPDDPVTKGYIGTSETYAIYVDSGDGTAILETQGVLLGDLYLGNANLEIETQQGHNVLWQFEEIPDNIILDVEDGAPAVFIAGDSGEDGIIVSAESDSNRAIALSQMVGAVSKTALDRMSDASANSGMNLVFNDGETLDNGDLGFWVDGQYQTMDYDDVLGDFSQTVRSYALSVGLLGETSNGVLYGLTFGGLSYDSDATGSADQEAEGAHFGVSLGGSLNEYVTLAFGLHGGVLQHDDSRTIQNNLVYELNTPDGFETATSSYDSQYFTPSLKLSVDIPAGENTVVTPSFGYRYTEVDIDSYTEQGTDTPISFGSQTVEMGEWNIGFDLTRRFAERSTFLASLDFTQRDIDGDQVDVTVNNNTGQMNLSEGTFNAATLGLGYQYLTEGGTHFNVNATKSVAEEGSDGYGVDLSLRVNF